MGVVRDMQLEDLDCIVELENKTQLHPWPREAFEQALRLGQSCWVYEGEGIEGYGVADRQHGRTIAALNTHAAGELYRTWLRAVADLDPPIAYAEIEASNAAARARLVRFGFECIGTRPRFYPGGVDAQVWQKTLEKPREDQIS